MVIAIDKKTLPKDGAKVKFFISNKGWKTGIFIATEQMFHHADDDFYFAYEVAEWEYA